MEGIGVIGVGAIGMGFVDRLTDAGYRVTVFDLDGGRTALATEKGATAAGSPEAVAREVETVILALPGSPEVEATMAGPDGLVAALDAGDAVVDATTTRPATSVACEEQCAAAGVDFVEAPITGGAPREGSQMMVGGTQERYERVRDVLDALCTDHARIGPVPEATVFKLGLQLRYAGHRAVDAEVVEFLRDNGVDPSPLAEFLGFDLWERYLTGDFVQDLDGLGGLAIWDKDVGYAREFARENGTALPLAAVVHEAYKAATRRSNEREKHAAALIRYWLALNDAAERYD